MKRGCGPPPIFIGGGSRGAASPPVEERVLSFSKEALRFEEMATPGEFWDMLHICWVNVM